MHSDICGPISPKTNTGFRYFVTFLNSATKWLEIALLRKRSDLLSTVKNFITYAENQFDKKIKKFHSDWAKEYKSERITELFAKKEIKGTNSAPYTPKQNSSAERINRTLLNRVRALLFDSTLDLYLWAEALQVAVYIYNRSPYSALNFITLYQAKNGTKPDLAKIKKWGSVAYMRDLNPKKLSVKALKRNLIEFGYN